MDGSSVNCDQIIAELINMGFEFSQVLEAVKAVGPSLEAAIEFILDDSQKSAQAVSCSSDCLNQSGKALGKRDLDSLNPSRKRFKQSKISEFQSAGTSDLVRHTSESNTETKSVERRSNSLSSVGSFPKLELVMANTPSYCEEEEDIGQDWEFKARNLMQKHFGYSSLKSFQKEALAAWVAHQDCLVLAATGSGKSLCFQIPALLTGKVVVVISPLISLMHDQCMKLAKHGVSCCFLGSGQTDHSVEQKAMEGMYGIIYICPETLVRLIKPLQSLAANRGIALFAIDEVHCISKWGHDFRPNYRRLSLLRENFRADNLKCLKFDIPLMALTATATIQVREDILNSLHMSDKTRVVLTSFFRPNLRFSVQHSSTSYPYSYEKDFRELIDTYNKKKGSDIAQNLILPDVEDTSYTLSSNSESEDCLDNIEDDSLSGNSNGVSFQTAASVLNERKLSVEFLEDEFDTLQDVDDFDVSCSEFCGQLPMKEGNNCEISDASYLRKGSEESPELFQEPLGLGPTIIYAPTRNETMLISEFLCGFGIKAAAYHAKLPKSHLRQVHKDFHENKLQVVAATVAFGMGIDKSNVRRIIHYGWPQSLEAYYQEAGRAGRDGKLADCVLYANFLKSPTLLPSKRNEEQTRRAYRMLSDCFRYGINTSCCRAETLVQYFGEEFSQKKCLMCDVCIKGPPELQNLKDEAKIFVQAIAAQYGQRRFADSLYSHVVAAASGVRLMEMRTLKIVINKLLQEQKYAGYGYLWWRGFARILEDKGFIREGADMIHVQINMPEPTQLGLEFLQSEQPFNVYPEADMLLSATKNRPNSTSAEWGRGWADPEIRRQRLKGKLFIGKASRVDKTTVRERLTAKLLKKFLKK